MRGNVPCCASENAQWPVAQLTRSHPQAASADEERKRGIYFPHDYVQREIEKGEAHAQISKIPI